MISPESISLNKTAIDKNADLYLSPSALNISSTSSATLDIILEHSSSAEIIQLEISYDPLLLYSLDIFPGNYFDNPTVSHKKIDEKNGRVSYVLEGTHDPVNSFSNTVARITFGVVDVWSTQSADLSFLPKTSVKAQADNIEFINMEGASVMIEPQYLALPATSSGIQIR